MLLVDMKAGVARYSINAPRRFAAMCRDFNVQFPVAGIPTTHAPEMSMRRPASTKEQTFRRINVTHAIGDT